MKTNVAGIHQKHLRAALLTEPAHDKTYNKTYVTSKDSDHPVQPPSMANSQEQIISFNPLKTIDP